MDSTRCGQRGSNCEGGAQGIPRGEEEHCCSDSGQNKCLEPNLPDLGRLEEAEAAFREVRNDFIRQEIGLEAAMVSLDLAMIFLERGDTGELKRLAAEMIPVFESRDDHQKALAAFLLFQKAAEAKQVTLGLLQDMASSLEQARRGAERG